MLRNYYAKLNSNPRHSLVVPAEPQKKKTKRTKSQSTFNNLTKTSEKSLKVKKVIKKTKNQRANSRSVVNRTIHKHKSSIITKPIVNKTKGPGKIKKPRRIKRSCYVENNLSDSYDSLLNGIQCDQELRKSLRLLVRLEKSALKKKFSSKSSLSSNSIFVNSYHNTRQ